MAAVKFLFLFFSPYFRWVLSESGTEFSFNIPSCPLLSLGLSSRSYSRSSGHKSSKKDEANVSHSSLNIILHCLSPATHSFSVSGTFLLCLSLWGQTWRIWNRCVSHSETWTEPCLPEERLLNGCGEKQTGNRYNIWLEEADRKDRVVMRRITLSMAHWSQRALGSVHVCGWDLTVQTIHHMQGCV